jgi:hypothetical protein
MVLSVGWTCDDNDGEEEKEEEKKANIRTITQGVWCNGVIYLPHE